VKDYPDIARRICALYPDPRSFRVLEIGSDNEGGLLAALAPQVGEVTGINIAGAERQVAPNARRLRGDIRQTGFRDGHFDLLVSHAVFEHVSGLGAALAEMRRILRPGGELVATFGPIWSCAWGHHLWVTRPVRHVYPQPPHLPPWCHLLMAPEALKREIAPTLGAEDAARVAEFVYRSDEQNRLMHGDYMALIGECGLEPVEIRPHRNASLEAAYLQGRAPLQTWLDRLTERHGPGDYLTASMTIRLRK
jgi:SAM-dependent methyltransferase